MQKNKVPPLSALSFFCMMTAMAKEPLPRLDRRDELYQRILPLCRLEQGQVWEDEKAGHRVAVADAKELAEIQTLCRGERVRMMIQDPPYNIRVGGEPTASLPHIGEDAYLRFTRRWLDTALPWLDDNAHLYIWLGADQKRGFHPLPEVMLLLREYPRLRSRSFISLRNQRGYGTQKNWMAVRQELLYYVQGDPPFTVTYTEIPKTLKGYYKEVNGEVLDNPARGRGATIRPGNIWFDIQQVFYRMHENVPGAFAQKPLPAIERIILSGSAKRETVADFFAHSGTTLLAAERLGRRCFTCDIDPVFAELTIRRLEHYRATGRRGWQFDNPFPELED
jgi:site-specific DNA-methyltransferase (adenine-specific)